MMQITEELYLQLVRLGIRNSAQVIVPSDVNWGELYALAQQQGLSAIVLDGIEKLQEEQKPPKELLLNWIGEVLQEESTFFLQGQVAKDVASLFYTNRIKTYVLKGAVVSECYPKPNHRVSSAPSTLRLRSQSASG